MGLDEYKTWERKCLQEAVTNAVRCLNNQTRAKEGTTGRVVERSGSSAPTQGAPAGAAGDAGQSAA